MMGGVRRRNTKASPAVKGSKAKAAASPEGKLTAKRPASLDSHFKSGAQSRSSNAFKKIQDVKISPFVCAGSAKPQKSIGQWVVCAIPAKLQKSMGQWVDVPAKFLEPGGCWTSNPAGHRVGPGVALAASSRGLAESATTQSM